MLLTLIVLDLVASYHSDHDNNDSDVDTEFPYSRLHFSRLLNILLSTNRLYLPKTEKDGGEGKQSDTLPTGNQSEDEIGRVAVLLDHALHDMLRWLSQPNCTE